MKVHTLNLRNCQTGSKVETLLYFWVSWFTLLCSHQQDRWTPDALLPCYHLILSSFFKKTFSFFFFRSHHRECGTLVPQPGADPMLSAVEAGSLNLWTTRKFPEKSFWQTCSSISLWLVFAFLYGWWSWAFFQRLTNHHIPFFFFLQHWVFLAFCAGFLQLQQVKATLHVVLRLLIAVASLAAEHRL